MIEFITNHPIWTGVIIYLLIGALLSYQFVIVEGTNMVILEKEVNEITNHYLAIFALVNFFAWPIFLLEMTRQYNKQVKYFRDKQKKSIT